MLKGKESSVALPERGVPPFAALRAFEALVRLGGVRKAAQSLGIHRTVVSRHLSHLEARLNVSLLRWSGNHFSLTDDGKRYHARISAAIAEITQATTELLGNELDRPVRIWCSHGLSIQWLISQIAGFEREHPNIRIDLRPSDVPADLRANEADVNIFLHLDNELVDAVESGLQGFLLARPLALIAASPSLAEQLSWITSARDLINVPLLHGKHTNDWRQWFVSKGVDAPAQLPGELCWHPHMALEAARLGHGVLLSTRFFVERDLERGDLVELKVPGTSNSSLGGYVFVAREDRWMTPRIASLRHFLAERMKVMEQS